MNNGGPLASHVRHASESVTRVISTCAERVDRRLCRTLMTSSMTVLVGDCHTGYAGKDDSLRLGSSFPYTSRF